MSLIGGVILDESVLLRSASSPQEPTKANHSSFQLRPGASSLLRTLQHSQIRTGIAHGQGLSADQVNLLKKMVAESSCDFFPFDESKQDTVSKINQAWAEVGGSIMYVVSDKVAFPNLGCHWLIIVVGVKGASTSHDSSLLHINKLQELPLSICRLNKKAAGSSSVMVGYIMKPSRVEDFAKRGAFPMRPTPNGLIFLPLTYEIPLSSQLQEIDAVLHKATDDIVGVKLGTSSESSSKITFTTCMQELGRFMENHSDFLVIDPLDKVYPVIDRLKIQQILLGLQNLNADGCCTIRAPHFLKVSDFSDTQLVHKLLESKLSLPSIVKPQVACGVADAHSMAIVFRIEDFKNLSVPLPAVVQEFVNHSSTIFKFYVLGKNVFHAVKKSIPNSDVLEKLYERNGLKPIHFDSLKSLPTDNEGKTNLCKDDALNLGLVKDAAELLGNMLDLTIFGFDVVIQEGTGDHVIVDVNYLPSFKEVPNDIAIPALWDAIKMKLESKGMEKTGVAAAH